MADFSPPFGHAGSRRFQNSNESHSGFNCLEASRELMTALQYGPQAEIGHVISNAGLVPTNSDFTQFRQAIELMIADAIYNLDLPDTPPDPDTSAFVRLNLARIRFPIFPVALTSNGKVGAYSPSTGVVRIPGGVWLLHRGIYQFSTHQIDLSTSPNKTYHLRWSYNPDTTSGTYELKDLSDSSYNPGSLPETNSKFDSSFDSMLMARVVTTSTNSPIVTDLVNTLNLSSVSIVGFECLRKLSWFEERNSGVQLNWARTPFNAQIGLRQMKSNKTDIDGRRYPISAIGVLQDLGVRKTTVDRYGAGNIQYTYNDSTNLNYGHAVIEWSLEA